MDERRGPTKQVPEVIRGDFSVDCCLLAASFLFLSLPWERINLLDQGHSISWPALLSLLTAISWWAGFLQPRSDRPGKIRLSGSQGMGDWASSEGQVSPNIGMYSKWVEEPLSS